MPVIARPSSLVALGTLELVPGPPDKVSLNSPGPEDPTELSGLGVSHVDVKLIEKSLFALARIRIDLGTLWRRERGSSLLFIPAALRVLAVGFLFVGFRNTRQTPSFHLFRREVAVLGELRPRGAGGPVGAAPLLRNGSCHQLAKLGRVSTGLGRLAAAFEHGMSVLSGAEMSV
eukprot:2188247-Pyramimonas_sp.AAC.1